MAFEPPANNFRAGVRAGAEARRAALVVKGKKARRDKSAKGLAAIAVERTERRRGNQRGSDRHRLIDERAVLRHKRKAHEVELINLSGGGAMVEGPLKLHPWDRIELVLGDHGEVECAVRWVKGNRVGLEFAHETRLDCDPLDRDALLRQVIERSFPEAAEESASDPQPTAAQRRGNNRHPLIWSGLVHHNYETDPVRLRNVSAGGALVQCSAHLTEGSTVYLDLGEAGKLAADVCWTRGDQSGLSFHEPFDLHALSKLRPDVAPLQWNKPDYLADDDPESSPWASQWGRLTVAELSRTLGG